MKKWITVLAILFIFITQVGCKDEELLGAKREAINYIEKTIQLNEIAQLNLSVDSADISIYTWNRKDIKFEITQRIRAIENGSILKEKLDNFKTEFKAEGSKIFFSSMYKQKNTKYQDIKSEIKITLPKKMELLKLEADAGNIIIFDSLLCAMDIDFKTVNTQINYFEGNLKLHGDMGNFKISNGKLDNGSIIKVNTGNINIKANFEENGDYTLETEIGNIDLFLPTETKLQLESIGNTESNVFKASPNPIKLKVKSGIGKINISKF